MARFLDLLLAAPEVKPLLSSEHFSVDGTLLRAWASHSSLERIDGLDDGPIPPSDGKGFGGNTSGKKRAKGDFRGLLLSNQTHRSSTDGQARLFKKAPGVSAFLSFMGHCVLENRNGLVVASEVTQASGTAERDSALQMARSLKVPTRKHWVSTRATTPGILWLICASAASRPILLRTPAAAVDQRLMAALLAIRVTPNRSTPESGSNWSLAGSNKPLGSGSSRPGGEPRWGRCSGCMWWPTT